MIISKVLSVRIKYQYHLLLIMLVRMLIVSITPSREYSFPRY